jgi:Zn-dependent alcohol dehydrogenase
VAALVGCAVTTGFGAVVNDAAVRPGESIAVVGIGGVGVNALEVARLAGAEKIIALDANAAKRPIALESGATHFIDVTTSDAVAEVKALTHGRGVDHAIECTGRPTAMTMSYELTRPAGSVVIVGIAAVGSALSIPAIGFPGSKKRIIGSIYGGGVPERDIGRVLALYHSGHLALARQIGQHVPLERINDALDWLEGGVMQRTIVVPN